MGNLEMPSFEFKRSNKPPKRWNIPFEKHLRNLDKNDREAAKREQKATWQNLPYDLKQRADEMKQVYLYPDKRKSFQDDEFFLTKAWGEFVELATEDIEEIIKSINEKLINKEEKTRSEGERKFYLERKFKKLQEDVQKKIKILIPNLHELDKKKQLDLLDQMFEEIKEKIYGNIRKPSDPPAWFSEAVNKKFGL